MVKCKKCYHDCHCSEELHADEYGICVCDNCKCKRTYIKEKDHGLKSLDQIFRDKWNPSLGHRELKFKKLPRSYCTVFDWGIKQLKRPRRFAAADDEASWTKAIKTALLSFKDKPVIEHYQYSRKFWLNKHNKKNDK